MNVLDTVIKAYLLANVYTVKNPDDRGPVLNITPSYEDEQVQFGTYGDDCGQLAILFPEVFSREIMVANHPNTAPSYARGIVALDYISDYHYYSAEKHEFSECEAFHAAEQAGMKYLIMENMS